MDKDRKKVKVNFTKSSTLQFPDSNILNHRIIAASFVEKGSHSAQGDRNVAFFVVRE
jgi:hypothetical protein